MTEQQKRNLGIFVAAVIASGWLGVMLDAIMGIPHMGDSPGMGIWLTLPLATALIIILLSKISWAEVGVKPNLKGNMKWYAAAILIYPVVTAMIVSIGALTGWMDTSPFRIAPFAAAFGSTLLANFLINIFEEGAWRGYLTSRLLQLNWSDWRLYLAVACIWTLWHVPYYLVFLPETDIRAMVPVSRGLYLLVAFSTFLSWSVMYTELFRISKSVWPGVIMHTVEDSLINHLVISGHVAVAAGREILISPVNGLITSLLYIAAGLAIRACRKRREAEPAARRQDEEITFPGQKKRSALTS